jgi:cephalosporin hydroxylase
MNNAAANYLKWFYETGVWKQLQYRGVRTLKLPLDVWNYQELMFENDVHWVLETGTRHGGSALYFADLLASGAREGKVISVDVTHEDLHPGVASHPRIQLLLGDSAAPATVESIRRLIPSGRAHGVLLILDSDHAAPHVLRELNALVPLLRPGDYLVVEDTIVNGHPVRPEFGPGPLEALEIYLEENPAALVADTGRESKFGCSFAYRGYFKVRQPPAAPGAGG